MKNQQKKQSLLSLKSDRKQVIAKSSFFSLFKYADRVDKTLMGVGTLAAIGAGVASPLFMIYFSTISEIFIPGNEDQAEGQGRELFVKLFLVGIFTWVCHAVAIWGWSRSGSRQTLRLKKIYYAALLRQEMAWYDSRQTSKITSQISQNTLAIEAAIGEKISIAVTSLVTSAFGFVFSFVKCWQMSLYLAIFLPFMLAAGFLMMKSLTMKAQTSKISYENASGIAETAFGAIKTIKTLVSQKYENNKFCQALAQAQPKLTKHILYYSLSSAFMNLVMMGIYSFGFFIGKQMLIDHPGQYRPSDIISTFFCFMVAGQTIGQISPTFKNVADAKIAGEKIYDLINREQTLVQNDEGLKLEQIDKIQIDHVQFSYHDIKAQASKTVLKDITMQIRKGAITAIVGSSGSGKSTIAQLLLHFYAPTAGQIKINGHQINELNVYEYRKQIGYVGQQPVLFSMSIRENIKIANPTITDQEIKHVLQKAYAWDFVQNLENGVDTYVGSKGAQLSGGQKQRIAIARTLAKNPQLIILDEATSALDQNSEREVQKTIANLVKENIAVVVIAHRLSTIRNADNIVVIDQGKIAQTGSHEELVEMNGIYFRLIQKQLESQMSSTDKLQDSKEYNTNGGLVKPSEQKKQNIETLSALKQVSQTRTLTSICLQLAKHTKNYWHYFAVGSLFALINGLVYPFFNATFSNVIGLMANPETNNQLINQFCLAFLLIAVVASISNFIHNFLYALFGEKLVYLLRAKVFKKMLKFSCSYYDQQQNTPGAISVRLSQNSYQLHNVLTGMMSVICLNLSTIVASLAFALYFSWKLTLIVLIFSPLMAAKGAIAATVLKRITKESDQVQKNMGSFISDTIGNIRTVKSFGGYDQFEKVFNENLDKIEIIISQKFMKMGILQGFSRSSAVLVYSVVFWIAAALFAANQFSQPIDALVAIFCIVFSATTVGQNSQLMPDLAKAENSANNILNTLETTDEYQIAKRGQDRLLKKYKIQGKIEFRNVNFKYPSRQQQILDNFSLTIKQGEKIALVGPSGSGKSTIFHILLRLYQISSGEVLVDGRPLQSYNLRNLRKQMGMLSQQPTIFNGSVQSNIMYQLGGKQKYSNRFKKYTRISCVEDIVENWQQRYEKQVGERGCLVSGGQKQRIALARCLMKNPRILLMDEPTSALDIESESKLFANLQQVMQHKTVVFSAHRMCTVKYAEKIVVMDKGRIVEQGTYNQLLQKNGQFYNLVYGNKQNQEK